MAWGLGLDFGTSGLRGMVLDRQGVCHGEARLPWGSNGPRDWCDGLDRLILGFPPTVRSQLGHVAIAGTSGTVLLCDRGGDPCTEVLWYDDGRAAAILPDLRQQVPQWGHGATGSFAKLWWWYRRGETVRARYLLHQADWIAGWLHGHWGISDYHNALKLGYDPEKLAYPEAIARSPVAHLLPEVRSPGEGIAPLRGELAQRWGLPRDCLVHGGTTDSLAAFMASGVTSGGIGVTSLGSTLVLKTLSDRPLHDPQTGIYSHRYGDRWLVGGASNTGGAVLAHFFTPEEMERLSATIDPRCPSPFAYYPLLRPGERFPLGDPQWLPCLEPRPGDRGAFLYGLLQGIARIETLGYETLQRLGTPVLTQVLTTGGGAKNRVWQAIRQNCLGVPVTVAPRTEAAEGAARLALGLALSSP